MARRSTKAGPARSRRRPDPSTRLQPAQTLAIPVYVSSGGSPGVVFLNVQLYSPADGQAWSGADWVQTGSPSNAYFIDSTGARIAMELTSETTGNILDYRTTGTNATGNGVLVMPGLDPAVRTDVGDQVGTFLFNVTVE